MRRITVTHRGTEIKLAYCLKVLFTFEAICDKRFEIRTLTDTYIFVWCCIIVADPDYLKGDYAKFIDACEQDPELFKVLSEAALKMLQDEGRKQPDSDTDGADDKKKD